MAAYVILGEASTTGSHYESSQIRGVRATLLRSTDAAVFTAGVTETPPDTQLVEVCQIAGNFVVGVHWQLHYGDALGKGWGAG